MKYLNKDIGSFGENLAKDYLINEGYSILDTNYRCKLGEIDIICKNRDMICFTEVKTRYFNSFGYPMEAVNYKKQRKIYNIAQLYCMQHRLMNLFYRFDVIEVILDVDSNDFTINLIKSAF